MNVTEATIAAINKLTGEGGLYPSRSELIRVATREWLIREIDIMKRMIIYGDKEEPEEPNPNIVKVPEIDENGDKNFKTYKILRRLT